MFLCHSKMQNQAVRNFCLLRKHYDNNSVKYTKISYETDGQRSFVNGRARSVRRVRSVIKKQLLTVLFFSRTDGMETNKDERYKLTAGK